eukprot:3650301-Rhodomonas_salina.1
MLGNDASATLCFARVLDIEDPKDILIHILLQRGRTVTNEQMEAVLAAFGQRSERDKAGTPLWLTLAASLAATWKSRDTAPSIPTSVRELIIKLFDQLT